MDVFNRPPAISEDTLQYTIYPAQNVSDRAAVTTFAAVLIDYVDILLPGHIWHRDAFEVKVVPHPEVKDNWILEGRMRVGDSVDDEWCTVWLLKEISSQWDLVISVFDSDGEFLLIEAAEVLPLWAQPKNSENRVWIYASRLHLIPLSHSSPPSRKRIRRKILDSTESDNEGSDNDDDEFITPDDAVKLVRSPFVETLAPPIVEKAVWERISGYPAARRKHVHTTNAYIPIDIAKALVARPHLVQKSVEAFYTRDAIQLRIGGPSDVAVAAWYVGIATSKNDQNGVRTAAGTKILSAQGFWTVARKRGNPRVALEGCRYENRRWL